jgi:lysophospholipase L1-like esterase
LLLAACGGSDGPATTRVAGLAVNGENPLAGQTVTVCDAEGRRQQTRTDAQGAYEVDVEGWRAPLLISVSTAPFVEVNGVPQPLGDTVALAAVLPELVAQQAHVAHVTPFTDKVASDVAITDLGLKGSVQLINRCHAAGIQSTTLRQRSAELRQLLDAALRADGVPTAEWDPVSAPLSTRMEGARRTLARVVHARDGWGSGSDDQLRASRLLDRAMQEVSASQGPLDPALPAWSDHGRRVVVVGDSTASTYGREVAPRMGWGQVLARQLVPGADVGVVNLAQSGRSSRSFINEGWMRILRQTLRPGDWLLIQWGHNDEKCDTTGSLDWVNRCTYPNDAAGQPRGARVTTGLPSGTVADDLSFQRSLEKYIAVARQAGAVPILVTPVTRINRDTSVTTHVEGRFPITQSTHVTTRGDQPGDYSQTVRDTARAQGVALVDLDRASMAWANQLATGTGGPLAEGGWRDAWLAVRDNVRYPYYASSAVSGHVLNADRTHFQEAGAVGVARLIVEGLQQQAALTGGLAGVLR